MLKIDESALAVIKDCVKALNEAQERGAKDPEVAEHVRGLRKSLRNGLLFMHQYACYREDGPGFDLGKTRCELFKDWAPLSFAFRVFRGADYWFNGGLIFHGSHDNGGDGGAPTLTVSLSPANGWSVHT